MILTKKEAEEYKKIIEKSGLFDFKFYLKNYRDARLANKSPLEHYITYGLYKNRKPNEWFDPVWYKEYYQDVKEDGGAPLIHYILFGVGEFRFANEEEYNEYISLENIFNHEDYKNRYEDFLNFPKEFDFLWHYVHHGKKEGREYAPLASEEDIQPLADTLDSNLDSTAKDLNDTEKHEYHILSNSNIDFSKYFSLNNHPFISNDAIIDYIKNWRNYTPIIPDMFDTSYYLFSYPDIKEANINPLVHFLSSGEKEGRLAQFDKNKISQGRMPYKNNLETILFVSHESSASGAPLLGYNVIKILSKKYNIVNIVIKRKELHDDFLNYSCELLTDIEQDVYGSSFFFIQELQKKCSIKGVILNSIVTNRILALVNTLKLPSLLLIHEFSDYTKPTGTMRNAIMHADNIIVPASIIDKSLQEELNRLSSYSIKNKINSISILPQGKLPEIPQGYGENDSVETLYKKLNVTDKSKVKIVVGSGWVQPRKGVDLFIATAKYIKKQYKGTCKFVWVGDGFEPETDMAYSVWLQREINFANLDDDFIFLKHQKNLDTIFSIADVFCLTSRMDPFPNVVIDALEKDLHIACFDNASGSVEFLQKHRANCTVVDYIDTYALAKKIATYLRSKTRKKGINQKLVTKYLNFNDYADNIDALLSDSITFNAKVQKIVSFLLEKNLFNEIFFNGVGEKEEQCQLYVQNALKGLRIKNPTPGFSELVWLEKNSPDNPLVVALYEAAKKGETHTHKAIPLPADAMGKSTHIDFHYAVHLHLFYVELADEYAQYFKCLPGKYDILVTIVNMEDHDIAEDIFSQCGASNVYIEYVENIGRDTGPLFFGLRDIIAKNNYEVIGHYHTKKSRDIDDGLGDRWRNFLTETLLGNQDIADFILNLFQKNTNLGLIFPEDSHIVDIGKNEEYIDTLCQMLQITKPHNIYTFPLGNMYWARVEAIKPLFSLEADKILEAEPLPYDGSFMHAMERIFPSLVESRGFIWNTVYKEGVQW